MKIAFEKDGWNQEEITYAYSYRFEETPLFVQRAACIENSKNEDAVYGFDNISLLTRKKYHAPVTVSTRCSFEDLGAPLLVLADHLSTDSRGIVRYGNYLEVVLWKNGVNVWKMWMENGTVTWKQLLEAEFPVSENEIHTLSVSVDHDMLSIQADDKRIRLALEHRYPSFHLGINACEGINRFYDLTITETPDFTNRD